MNESVQSVQESEESPFTRRIEVRLVEPQARLRYEKGKPVKEPMPDFDRVIADIHPQIEEGLQAKYGLQTEVIITTGKAQDVRLTGIFAEKAGVIRDVVRDLLSTAFETLELGDE